MIKKVDKEIFNRQTDVDEAINQLELKQKRAGELHLQLEQIHKELKSIAEDEERLVDQVINPTKDKINLTAQDVVFVGDRIPTVEQELKALKTQVESYEFQAVQLSGELPSFQDKFRHF